MPKKRNILLGICGGIAAYKTCELTRALVKSGYEVKCIMSPEAEYFIAPLTLSYLSGNKVYTDMFELPDEMSPHHVSLADWADIIVVVPATAHMISKLAVGLADDLISCTILDTKAPVLICPAMHENMYKNQIIKENCSKLKARGFIFEGPKKGALLDRKKALGHLQDIDVIIKSIKKIIK